LGVAGFISLISLPKNGFLIIPVIYCAIQFWSLCLSCMMLSFGATEVIFNGSRARYGFSVL
jgi:hypothetical protein